MTKITLYNMLGSMLNDIDKEAASQLHSHIGSIRCDEIRNEFYRIVPNRFQGIWTKSKQ